MTNIAQYYLTSGTPAPRLGNAHASIVPYQMFEAADGHVILAVGNREQYARFAAFAGHPEWADDPRFAHNSARVAHREELVQLIKNVISQHSVEYWVNGLNAVNVPCGPVNTMDKVFEMEQIQAREMEIEMNHALTGKPVKLVGSPLKMSESPVRYTIAPPICGQHTEEVLKKLLDYTDHDIAELKAKGICG
jgi:crotonobetainyl-CoA:carnitine CoA-transferase CaiB-like acyl-CoA transferase